MRAEARTWDILRECLALLRLNRDHHERFHVYNQPRLFRAQTLRTHIEKMLFWSFGFGRAPHR
ncbi:MAG: hypothetical protein QM784_10210 [Polyangiaceae bacterium]